jgi:hypothetical protein
VVKECVIYPKDVIYSDILRLRKDSSKSIERLSNKEKVIDLPLFYLTKFKLRSLNIIVVYIKALRYTLSTTKY